MKSVSLITSCERRHAGSSHCLPGALAGVSGGVEPITYPYIAAMNTPAMWCSMLVWRRVSPRTCVIFHRALDIALSKIKFLSQCPKPL